MRRSILFAAFALVPAASACGAADDDGSGSDAGGDCTIAIAASPAEPAVGEAVALSAEIVGGSGFAAIEWTVSFDDELVAVETTGAETATFTPTAAGIHRVEVSGTAGGPCAGDAIDLNVVTPGVERAVYRLAVTPPAGAAWRFADRTIEIPGGADYSVGALATEQALLAEGTARLAGTPLAAYLRARRIGGGGDEETAAGADGAFALRVLGGSYDLDVVPADPARPPHRFAAVAAEDLGGAAELEAGALIDGVVRDADDQLLAGATVAIAVAGGVAAVASTDVDGRFAIRAQVGAPAVVTVEPPDGEGLEVTRVVGGGLADGATLAIEFTALPTRSLAATATTDDDGPAPGARVHLAAEVPGAATIAVDGASVVVAGRLRRTLVAGAGGGVPIVSLPRVTTTVIVEPGPGTPIDQAASIRLLLLASAAPPDSLALATPATLSGTLADVDGAPLAGARLVARPTGPLAGLARATASTTTASDGGFVLAVPPGADLAIEIDAGAAGRRIEPVAALAAAEARILPLAMPHALRITGRLTGGDLGGARVALYCAGGPCDPLRPVAEAAASAAGRFVLAVPDPEVAR